MESLEDRVADDAPIKRIKDIFAVLTHDVANAYPGTKSHTDAQEALIAGSAVVAGIVGNVIGTSDDPALHAVRADAARYILGLPDLQPQTPQQ